MYYIYFFLKKVSLEIVFGTLNRTLKMVNDLIFQNQVSLYSVTKGLQSSYTNIFNYLLSWKLYLDTLDYMYHSVYLVPSQFLVANYLIRCTNIMSNKKGRGLYDSLRMSTWVS